MSQSSGHNVVASGWAEFLNALGRQDALGYLRARCRTPQPALLLCEGLADERRMLSSHLDGAELGDARNALASALDGFFARVQAEACGWTRGGPDAPEVWPWPAVGPPPPVARPDALKALERTCRQVLAELELRRLLPLLVEGALGLTHAEASLLALVNPERATLDVVETRGLPGPLPHHLPFLPGDPSLAGEGARRLDPAGTAWLGAVCPPGRGPDGATALVAPLRHQGELLGVLVCLGPAPAFAEPGTADVLSVLAGQTAIAIRNAVFYRQIHRSAAALKEANERLRSLDLMKDRFLATVSHELRTPLSHITGFGHILLDGEDAEPLTEEQRHFVRKMLDGSMQLATLVNDLLDYSSIRAGHLSLLRTAVEPVTLLDEMVELFKPQAQNRGIALDLAPMGPFMPVSLDRERIRQVLTNLIANALKFTPRGGTVRLLAERRGDDLRIGIEDTGPGIAPASHTLLFQHFSQLEETRQIVGGTGLGLAISKSLIEAHGGTIGLDSPAHPDRPYGDGAGCVFWFTLPL